MNRIVMKINKQTKTTERKKEKKTAFLSDKAKLHKNVNGVKKELTSFKFFVLGGVFVSAQPQAACGLK